MTANQRHFKTSRLASTFSDGRKVSVVVHRRTGSNPMFPMWNWMPHNAVPGQIDLQAVLTHELGHCFHLMDLASGDKTMVGDHEYSRQRFGPWPCDIDDVKALYSNIGTNRLRALRSADGITWSPHPARAWSFTAGRKPIPSVRPVGRAAVSGRLSQTKGPDSLRC